jgi:hypothetical protein
MAENIRVYTLKIDGVEQSIKSVNDLAKAFDIADKQAVEVSDDLAAIGSTATKTGVTIKQLNSTLLSGAAAGAGIKQAGKALQDVEQAAKKANAPVAGSVAELKQLQRELKQLEIGSDAFIEAQVKVNKLQEELNQAREAAGLLTAAAGGFDPGSLNDLNAQLKALQGNLAEARVGTQAYIEASEGIERVQRQIAAASMTLKEQTTQLLGFAGTAVGAFAQASAAVQAYAGDNEDVKAVLLELNKATALSGAITGAIELSKQVALVKTIAVQTSQIAVTNAATLATRVLGTAVKTALGPIGLLIAAGAALVAILSDSEDATEDNTEAQIAAREAADALQERIDELAFAQKKYAIETSGASRATKDLQLAQLDLTDAQEYAADIAKQLEAAEKALAQVRASDSFAARIALKANEEAVLTLREEQLAANNEVLSAEKRLNDLRRQQAKEAIDIQTERTTNALTLQKLAIDGVSEEDEIRRVALDNEIRRTNLLAEQRKAAIDGQVFDLQRLAIAEKEAAIAIDKVRADFRAKREAEEKARQEQAEAAAKAEAERIAAEIERERKAQLELTKVQLEGARDRAKAAADDVANTFAARAQAIREATAQEAALLEAERAELLRGATETEAAAINARINNQLETLYDSANAKADALAARGDNPVLKILGIDSEQGLARFNEAISTFRGLGEQLGQEVDKIFANLNARQVQALDAQIAAADARLAAATERADAAKARIDALTGQLAEADVAQSESIKRALETETAARDAALAEEQRIEAEKERLKKRGEQLQLRRARAEKRNAIIQAGISTSLAIVNALANNAPPPPFNTPFVVAAGALGAAQVAAIAASPPPQFAEGGFTGRGGKYEVGGIVHKGEWVAPKAMVESPNFAPILAMLEAARQRGTYAEGGIVGGGDAPAGFDGVTSRLDSINNQLAAALNRPVIVDAREVVSVADRVAAVREQATL